MEFIRNPEELDYNSLGLVAGLEIHQQLKTSHKLFCRCPLVLNPVEESSYELLRYLRAGKGELGETDVAALAEVKKAKKHIYKGYDTTCLVENDEEPPSVLNTEALELTLLIAKMLHSTPVDQVHTMRKTVVDGSNTTGFQRTALVAMDGWIESSMGRVGIETICLEEEACQKVEERESEVVWSLDRLGIPLVEICTSPDLKTPEHVKEVALKIGMLLRSTRKVRRGIGTIRQDVNVSVRDGARVEIKGVQELGLIDRVVAYEAMRQHNLLVIRNILRKRNANVRDTIYDITDVFSSTKSKVLKKAGKPIVAIVLEKFGGLVGCEIQPNRRFGSELADYARSMGVGGVFHTDELPSYGITDEEIERLRKRVDAGEEDCIVFVCGPRAYQAIEAVRERAKHAIFGIPNETRRVLPDGCTSYMRPLPGAARMYPETDVPPVDVDFEWFESLELPETLEERVEHLTSYGISSEMAHQLVDSEMDDLFEEIIEEVGGVRGRVSSTVIARTLTSTLSELRREDVDVAYITHEHLRDVIKAVANGMIAKEGIPELLKKVAETRASVGELLSEVRKEEVDVEGLIRKVVEERKEFVLDRGEMALGPLMGVVMKELRGKVDGKVVSQILKKVIEETVGHARKKR
ncbi:Glu-tRNA(Gln) amidotransferase GatDE subunit E [Methanosarcinales archaeon]|nr:MAG: Glu-tRNA(Gln) amidotransferase GatDE subunit E [Methanosarcinales archaeon]